MSLICVRRSPYLSLQRSICSVLAGFGNEPVVSNGASPLFPPLSLSEIIDCAANVDQLEGVGIVHFHCIGTYVTCSRISSLLWL